MPQMSPLMWAPLFIMVVSMFTFSMVKLFFLNLNSITQNKSQNIEKKTISWVW